MKKNKSVEVPEKIQRLRQTAKWKFFYQKLTQTSDGKPFKNPYPTWEDFYRSIDRLCILKVDPKDPSASYRAFKDIYLGRRK